MSGRDRERLSDSHHPDLRGKNLVIKMRPKINRWVLTPHAVKRIFERKISLEELADLIGYPEDVIAQGPKLILTRTFPRRRDNKIAAVVVEKQGDDLWLVITVMVNFQAKK